LPLHRTFLCLSHRSSASVLSVCLRAPALPRMIFCYMSPGSPIMPLCAFRRARRGTRAQPGLPEGGCRIPSDTGFAACFAICHAAMAVRPVLSDTIFQ
jgi:hypothetical protein